jgi:hypothetical protein
MNHHRAVPTLIAALAVATLAGCAAPGPTSEPTPAGGPPLGIECDAVVGSDVLAEAFGPDLRPTPLSFDGAGGYYTLSQIGLSAAGALRCEWSDGGVTGTERYLTLSVLPDAAADWAALSPEVAIYQPTADGFGDDSWHTCSETQGYSACRIDVLDGDRWLSAVLAGVADTAAAAIVVDTALTALAAAPQPAAGTPRSPHACDDVLTSEQVGSALGGAVDRVELPAPVQPVVFHAGFLRAGGTHCYWRNGLGADTALAVHLGLLPDGAGTWEDDWAVAPTARVVREPLDGLGDAAFAGCVADVHCFASVRVGEDRIDVTVSAEGGADERALAVDLARLAIASL